MGREYEIRKEIEVEASPEEVWQAIATGPGITAWFMPHEVEPGEGGKVRLTVEGYETSADITAWEPHKRLAYRGETAEDGTVHAMEYLIEGRDGAAGSFSVLRFVHSGFLGDDWSEDFEAGLAHGWDMYLHTLREYVTHFAGRPVVFVNANGPAVSAEPGRWPTLLAGLGLEGPVEVGQAVRVTPAGLPPLDGVVDYREDEFLGVRTGDGLYRFHGMARMGMPVAIGHHIFRDDLDRVALDRDWTAWLADLYT